MGERSPDRPLRRLSTAPRHFERRSRFFRGREIFPRGTGQRTLAGAKRAVARGRRDYSGATCERDACASNRVRVVTERRHYSKQKKVRMATGLSGKRTLVTGANGFIGAHLCRRLCKEGAEVHAVYRTRRPADTGDQRWWQADLVDLEEVRKIV